MKIDTGIPFLEFTPQKMQQGFNPDKAQNFDDVLKGAINDVNKLQSGADNKITSLFKGESQDLHGTILAVQQADTSFKMMMQVRNKIVEAYKEISRTGM